MGRDLGGVSLSDSSGTEGEKSDSYQVFPDYSQLVPDRTEWREYFDLMQLELLYYR